MKAAELPSADLMQCVELGLAPYVRRRAYSKSFYCRGCLHILASHLQAYSSPPLILYDFEIQLYCFAQVFAARCTIVQSAVLRSHVVCLSVCPSVT